MITHSSLYIRADASPQIGTGHIMRCLALALAAKERGIHVRFIARLAVAWVKKRLQQEGMAVTEVSGDAPEWEQSEVLLAQLESTGESSETKAKIWVVLDGYHFGPDCHVAVQAEGYKLLVVDDYAHLAEHHCDILLNQNIGAEEMDYKGKISTRLLGPRYALLRPEFENARSKAQERIFPEKAQNILLTMGGGDYWEHLARIAPYFRAPELANCQLRIIAGAMQTERIRSLFQDCQANIEILDRVIDMPALLLDTDLCVTAGGSTCWELCCLGVPFLTVKIAENQHDIVYGLQSYDIAPAYALEAFSALILDRATRRKRADASSVLVDGLGAGRVISAMID